MASQAVQKDKSNTGKAVVVQDSLPLAADTVDTMPLSSTEMELLAENFEGEEPEVPAAPVVPGKVCLLFLRGLFLFPKHGLPTIIKRSFNVLYKIPL